MVLFGFCWFQRPCLDCPARHGAVLQVLPQLVFLDIMNMAGSVCKQVALTSRLSDSKRQKISLRKSKRYLALGFLFRAAAISVGFALIASFTNSGPSELRYIFAIYGTIILYLLVSYLFAYFNDIYVLREFRVMHFNGLVSLRLKRTSIAYVDIREINVQQNLLERILNVGSLNFGTASTANYELLMSQIARPHTLIKELENHINCLQKRQLEKFGTTGEDLRHHA